MSLPFAIAAAVTIASAAVAMSLRNLVHCALMLMLTFAGLAALYLQLGAQFVGFAQVLVYVGAVAILIVFAILLTRGSEPLRQRIAPARWLTGVAIASAVFGLLSAVMLSSRILTREPRPLPEVTVQQIGEQLMGTFVLPLEVMGLLLTAALIGGVIIAMHEKERE